MELLDENGKPVDLSTVDVEAQFQAIKDAPSQELPSPPKKARTEKPAAKPTRRTTNVTRTTKAAPKEPLKPKDYTAALDGLGKTLWVTAAAVPYTSPYAVLINDTNRAQMVQAWNAAANSNQKVRDSIEKMTSGEGNIWVLGVAAATIPIAMGAWQIYSNPEFRAQAAEATRGELLAFARENGLVNNEPATAPNP